MCYIFEEKRGMFTLNDKVRVKTNKEIWQGEVMRIPCSDMPCDANCLEINWSHTKTEYRVLIKMYHLKM